MESVAIPFTPVERALDWAADTGLAVALTVLTAVLVVRFVNWGGGRITDRIDANYRLGDALVRSEASKHRHSVAQVITWVVITIVWIIAIVQILDRLGLPIGSLVAPATVLGAALGFGAQRVVQDILAGFFIITERQYGFGDTVRIAITGAGDDAEGVIEDVTLRVTRMRNSDGEVITVPNGQIVKAVNLSKDWARAVVDVPVPATADINRVNEVLHQVGVAAFSDRSLKKLLLDEPTVMGVESLGVDEVSVRVVARTLPGKQFQVGRALRVRVAAALRRQGITVTPDLATDQGEERAE
ncbi:mechanosensitive ion channel family protein [Rhodococcus triatomae]|uniref:Small conductance mechanosensitive channel n=1 Tax=Rhodococcus triatomae TaxID=300028 RepID=A0A1G8F1W3_9NOCA|nr:mechanosensitive ion channel family protein [Rhodococcus triatomae]QNG19362.1 mechanosensitive ion channel family protein [Rhodococcus triatomae]QNG24725.1 mechanosensitive ion channel family protein [Rhodococcus triatomae]SDH76074.1 small conductance mechanosensitive channel [Rhodococcus triatomae]